MGSGGLDASAEGDLDSFESETLMSKRIRGALVHPRLKKEGAS